MLRFDLSTSRRTQAIDVTSLFSSREWPEGLLLVSVEHTTAAIFLGESGSEMFEDYERVAAGLIEEYGPWQHEVWNPGNAQSHVLSSFIGGQLLLPISHGRLDVGTWQRVIFLELDGPRQRQIAVASLATQSLEG
jgi:secondary thiamine-phosphate synthase enzyme